ncbi:MAG: FAD/NAD(P)-binding protein [Acidobacteriota bacterium]
MSQSDRELGMHQAITRRDFLNGMALGVGGSAAAAWLPPGLADLLAQSPYPPALTGLRGSHVGSFETFHALRDAGFWKTAPAPRATGEHYDLVVVGGGISGLAAAYYYRKARPAARVLVLDNHDDFGGHAKRNEYTYNGRTYIGYGGTQSIDSPAPYSDVARGLITELGIDVASYRQKLDANLYRSLGLRPGFFFDKATFGVDRLVPGASRTPDDAFMAAAPVSDAVRRDMKRLTTEAFDPLPDLTPAEKKRRLAKISYADFLTTMWKLDPGVLPFFQTRTHGLFGAGIDVVPAQDAHGLGFPGFQAMGLDDSPGPGQNLDSIRHEGTENYYFHFPDGNATIARLLVARLVPEALPATSMDDVVRAKADYGRLDGAGPARIRLSSTAVRVRHVGDAGASRRVDVTYARGRSLETVTADGVVLACWHTGIPLMCPELPAAQKAALAYAIKVPLVYTNVFIRSWTSFVKLGVQSFVSPAFFHTSVGLDFPVSVGGYQHPTNPDEPIVLHLSKSACKPGLPIREQHRAGRAELLATPFEAIERDIRDQMGRALGPGGFDPARDILGITVNRWPHGYAYQYNSMADEFWFEGRETPCEVARRRFGRIAIANADAAAYSYTDASIDQAHRAVQELLAG